MAGWKDRLGDIRSVTRTPAGLGRDRLEAYKARMTQSTEFRGRVYNDITETVGATPLVRLNRVPQAACAGTEILAKPEFNPMSSRLGEGYLEACPMPALNKQFTTYTRT